MLVPQYITIESPCNEAVQRTGAFQATVNQFGDLQVEKYYIYADTTENPLTRIDSTSNNTIDLINLANLKNYYFRITSVSTSGMESGFSNEVNAFVNYVEPGSNLLL